MKTEFENKRILVAGMALSGMAAARTLAALGAELYLYDRKPLEELSSESRSILGGIDHVSLLGRDPLEYVKSMDMIVVSPGLPPDLPFLREAERLGRPVISEIELGFRLSDADFIAITGTNGKTTTTALTGEIFRASGLPTYILGNIGDPISAHALATRKGDVVVAETAALQLDAIDRYRPVGSAVLNITPDHLDRYGTMENYTRAKARIFRNQREADYCVLNYDDPRVRALASEVPARKVWFSLHPLTEEDGTYVKDGRIMHRHAGEVHEITRCAKVRIPGSHNLQNALCAAALALEYGIDPRVCSEVLASFPGVEHRIETVRTVDGVTYINDSKGTNPDATIKAVEAMTQPIHLILGGFDKHAEFVDLMEHLKDVRQIIVLGETRGKIEQAAAEAGVGPVHGVDDLEEAVRWASSTAQSGDCVLLSPACASWDMYPNFEVRGAHFKRLVKEL